ncbi:MAG: PilW family protein [Zhongshania sp.]|uniref:PilW family protein n=1 Tax=Zhongshania sp. TaxID=1971902 RepID=UPI00261F709C|nr:PilW family protein [Zhongshania sp.]MDF1691182.1 PilW family protein [Zhongshania sp.]
MPKSPATQQGMSLVEIMISLGLGAFMLLGIISLMASVSSTRSALANTSDQIENGRYALQLLSEDLALAGFYGMYHPGVGVATYTLPDPCADTTNISDLGFAASPMQMPAPLVGYPATSTLPTCFAADAVSDSEALVVHRVEPRQVDTSTITTNDVPYLQTADCETGTPFIMSANAADLILQIKDCSTLAAAWPYVVRSYFISPCEDCSGGGDGKPTLKVHEFSGGVLATRALVAGVEDMHFSYGMDLDLNGSPDCYTSDPTADAAPTGCSGGWEVDDWKNWANVVSIRVSLLVRGAVATGGDTAKTFDLGRASRSGPFSDGYKRQVYSSVISVPNVGGVRESE